MINCGCHWGFVEESDAIIAVLIRLNKHVRKDPRHIRYQNFIRLTVRIHLSVRHFYRAALRFIPMGHVT